MEVIGSTSAGGGKSNSLAQTECSLTVRGVAEPAVSPELTYPCGQLYPHSLQKTTHPSILAKSVQHRKSGRIVFVFFFSFCQLTAGLPTHLSIFLAERPHWAPLGLPRVAPELQPTLTISPKSADSAPFPAFACTGAPNHKAQVSWGCLEGTSGALEKSLSSEPQFPPL